MTHRDRKVMADHLGVRNPVGAFPMRHQERSARRGALALGDTVPGRDGTPRRVNVISDDLAYQAVEAVTTAGREMRAGLVSVLLAHCGHIVAVPDIEDSMIEVARDENGRYLIVSARTPNYDYTELIDLQEAVDDGARASAWARSNLDDHLGVKPASGRFPQYRNRR